MARFRIPRKTKKKLGGKLWLYPPDEKGNRIMAFPGKNQDDYNALKSGIVEDLLHSANRKTERKAYREKLDKGVFIPDSELREAVDNIFARQFRNGSFNILIKAKTNAKAVVAYYNFVNAYFLYQSGEESFGNVCCMAADICHCWLIYKNKITFNITLFKRVVIQMPWSGI